MTSLGHPAGGAQMSSTVPPGAAEVIAVTPRSSLAAIVSTRQFCVPTCPPVLVSQAEMMGSWTKTVGEEGEAPLQIRTTGNGDLKLLYLKQSSGDTRL